MPQVDCNTKEVLLRIGVAGPPGAGKTQALWRLHAGLPPEMRAELVMRPMGADQIVSFDFTPPDLVPLADYRAKCRALTVPGKFSDPAILPRVMSDLDGVLFVADSQNERMGDNVAALRQIAAVPGLSEVPVVFLYNKRDLQNAAPLERLDSVLNRAGAPRFATVAVTGEGLGAALSELSRLVLRQSAFAAQAR
ncbi:MAG: ADP-ribosylation factor-like protein [Chthoniobacteraceae bacterium]